MEKKINSALISVFYKDRLDEIVKELQRLSITIYSTGGTQKFIEEHGIDCIGVDSLTSFPSILGGRVKTLHPAVFGGILARRHNQQDIAEIEEYKIPEIDLVIVDLYPFEETLKEQKSKSEEEKKEIQEQLIIEKIDIGGPSMIRAAAKNFKDVVVVASKNDHKILIDLLQQQNGVTTTEQRKYFAAKAFKIVMNYDIAINNYFNETLILPLAPEKTLRYGENPHQQASYYGNLEETFKQLNGKELSYNNLVDVDAALQLMSDFNGSGKGNNSDNIFAIIKHTNVCGIAQRKILAESWKDALAGDPESAFGGVLITNGILDKLTAEAINEIFFEVLIAPSFSEDALKILTSKKNRILLQLHGHSNATTKMFKSAINGVLTQEFDKGNVDEWKEAGGRETTIEEKEDLEFANIVCKHSKSNAIALVKNKQLIGKGCGQTSRIDALRQSIDKAKQFSFELQGAVLASDAFFPFGDCVKLAHEAGIQAFIEPGGSIRDKDTINYCVENNLALVLTGMRHFKH